MLQRILRPVAIAAAAIFLLLVGLVLAADHASPAYAAGGGKPAPSNLYNDTVAAIPPVAKGWSGCGGGLYGGWRNAEAEISSSVNLGANGPTAGLEGNCDIAYQSFLVGIFARYDWSWGDVHTAFGLDNTLAVGGRIGFLPTPSALIYAHGSWNRASFSGAPDINGIGGGLGIEVKIANTPFFADLRWEHRIYDGAFTPTLDVTSDVFTLALKYKFAVGGK